MAYEGPERRRQGADDVTGIIARVTREGVPLDRLTMREEGDARAALEAAVKQRIDELFGGKSAGQKKIESREKVPELSADVANFTKEQASALKNELNALGMTDDDVLVGLNPNTIRELGLTASQLIKITVDGQTINTVEGRRVALIDHLLTADKQPEQIMPNRIHLSKGIRTRALSDDKVKRVSFTVVSIGAERVLIIKKIA